MDYDSDDAEFDGFGDADDDEDEEDDEEDDDDDDDEAAKPAASAPSGGSFQPFRVVAIEKIEGVKYILVKLLLCT